MSKRLLLLSNSTNYKEDYLSWCGSHIDSFVAGTNQNIIFIPYAGVSISYADYTARVNSALSSFGIKVTNIEDFADKTTAIKEASAIFVGGGNTFHLLKKVQDNKLTAAIGTAVEKGVSYVGWSAGSNLACPTICTTNDMPIVQPHSFNALNLIPFQINPHFTQGVIEGHGGESRLTRLQEYLIANKKSTVACLPESSFIRIGNGEVYYEGESELIALRSDNEVKYSTGSLSDELLK